MAATVGFMTHVPAGPLPRTGISSGTLRSVIEYGLPFTFYLSKLVIKSYSVPIIKREQHIRNSARETQHII